MLKMKIDWWELAWHVSTGWLAENRPLLIDSPDDESDGCLHIHLWGMRAGRWDSKKSSYLRGGLFP